jgi:hypothetical protein
VTEDEWRNATDPAPMLKFLRGRVSDRKLRLFDVACCRQLANLLTDERSQRAVDAAEYHADGLLAPRHLAAARAAAHQAFFDASLAEWSAEAEASFGCTVAYCRARARLYASVAALLVVSGRAGSKISNLGDLNQTNEARWRGGNYRRWGCHYFVLVAVQASELVRLYRAEGMTEHAHPSGEGFLRVEAQAGKAYGREQATQADLLRDIVRPFPLRPAPIARSVLAWNDRLVVRLARRIYDERRWADLPILADALFDAGCEDDIGSHYRQQREHVRGCWLLDLILSQQ